MEASIIFLLCAVAAANAQLLNPLSSMGMGMGTGWGNSMWHSGMRYPGVMQTSQVNSMSYPTWRNHPLFRMVPAVSEKKVDSNLPSDVINIAKVPSTQEVLTHMALANQNPKPYLDTISDFLYEPQKTRAVVSPLALVNENTKPILDTITDFLYEPQKSRTVVSPITTVSSGIPVSPVAPVPVSSPVYVQGMNLMKASTTMGDDCGPDGTRWGRGMDWLY